MMRLGLALLLAIALLQTVVSGAAPCVEICPDETSGDPCALACLDCACCGHAVRAQVADTGVRAPHPPSTRERLSDGPSIVPLGDPIDIFHVPRFAFA